MAIVKSKLTSKYQVTIPVEVRRTLGLNAGDSLTFTIGKDGVRIKKTEPFDLVMAQASNTHSLNGTQKPTMRHTVIYKTGVVFL